MEGGAATRKAAAAGLLIARPLMLKAGVTLFVSLTGFICARSFVALRRRRRIRSNSIRGDSADDGRLCSDGVRSACADPGHVGRDLLIEDSESLVNLRLLALSSVITDLRERESSLEWRFLRYCGLKERESELLEIGYALRLERARLESLSREVERMEEDGKLLMEFSEECRKAVEEVAYRGRVEKLRLCSKLKKMKRRAEAEGIKLTEGRLRIEEKDRELAETRKENDELREKLAAAEKFVTEEETELVHLRWNSACLKHELSKSHGQEKQEDATPSAATEEEEGEQPVLHPPKKAQPPKKIVKKFKRWRGWIGGDDTKAKVNPTGCRREETRHGIPSEASSPVVIGTTELWVIIVG